MDFNWIKTIFKKKQPINNSVDIATIDTSFIHIPKFNELSKTDQDKVLDYYHKLNLDNYDMLVKYSDDIREKYDIDKEILHLTLTRYNEWYKDVENNNIITDLYRLIHKINYAVLSKYEYKYIYDDIINIRKELELRAVALNMFIKKESKRKYDFLGIFGKAERLKYLSDKNRLNSEYERLKIAIKDNIINQSIIKMDIKENDNLKEKYDLLNEYNTRDDFLDENVRENIVEILVNINKTLFTNSYLWDEFVDEIESLLIDEDNEKIAKLIPFIKMGDEGPWSKLIKFWSKEQLELFYKILAKYLHKHELYIINHKEDYKIFINEMNSIINEYERTRTKDWDVSYLRNKVDYYYNKQECYRTLYKKILPEDIMNELNNTFYKLDWLSTLAYHQGFFDLRIFLKHEDYYIDLSDELLRKVEEKYGIEFDPDIYLLNSKNRNNFNAMFTTNNYKEKKKIEKRREFIKKNQEYSFIDLFDLLNGYEDDIEIFFNQTDGIIKKHGLSDYLGAISDSDYVQCQIISSRSNIVPLENIFYLTKLFPNIEFNFNRTYSLSKSSRYANKGRGAFTNYVTQIKLDKLNSTCDKRILVIPDEMYQTLSPTHLLCTNRYTMAIYLPNRHYFDFYLNNSYISTFFIKHSLAKKLHLYNKYRCVKDSFTINNKVFIVVPNNIKYHELSNYLDEYLNIKSENKVLKKEI